MIDTTTCQPGTVKDTRGIAASGTKRKRNATADAIEAPRHASRSTAPAWRQDDIDRSHPH
ncbi:hypothetical protein [Burkholderia sp. Ac-20353]|uniref:hypothetical protein n=1 Tax=Burkholderia sp. Ac-20353 TaxID=2703894 RepID=UPI00197B6CD0|nr:hypothetical protein [Burkholderia sp. Ac-20353]